MVPSKLLDENQNFPEVFTRDQSIGNKFHVSLVLCYLPMANFVSIRGLYDKIHAGKFLFLYNKVENYMVCMTRFTQYFAYS